MGMLTRIAALCFGKFWRAGWVSVTPGLFLTLCQIEGPYVVPEIKLGLTASKGNALNPVLSL